MLNLPDDDHSAVDTRQFRGTAPTGSADTHSNASHTNANPSSPSVKNATALQNLSNAFYTSIPKD